MPGHPRLYFLIFRKDVGGRDKPGHDDKHGSSALAQRRLLAARLGFHVLPGKTMVGTADSQGSLPKTAASTYLDDNAVELSLCRGLLPAASL
jgi:hypothetical protein